MNAPLIPTDGTLPLARLAESLAELCDLAGVPKAMCVRSIAFQDRNGTWRHLVTVIGPTRWFKNQRRTIMVDKLALISSEFDASTIHDVDGLVNAVTHWRQVLKTPSGFRFQDNVNADRWLSHNSSFVEPAWVCWLYELDDDRSAVNIPNGPYFSADHSIFAPTILDLTVQWLELDQRERGTASRDYLLILPDRRAYLEHIESDGEMLTAKVTMSDEKLPVYCALAGETARATESVRVVQAVTQNVAAIPIPSDLNSLRLFLVTSSGEVLDEYREDSWGRSWGQSVLQAKQRSLTYAGLKEALESGESDRVEFKAWMPTVPREKKSYEILQSAVAFANTNGGAVYIGITNNGEPIGVSQHLRATYAKTYHGDVDSMKEAYVRDLRKLIAEGVNPAVNLHFEWIDSAHQPILKIGVPRAETTVHSTAEHGEIYIRAGGTNRKMRHDDIAALNAKRQQSLTSTGGRGTRLF